LPSFSLPYLTLRTDRKGTPSRKEEEDFDPCRIDEMRILLSPLAVTGIDKCAGGLLLQCPILYGQKYRTAFSEIIDPGHFSQEFDTEEQCLLEMKHVFDKNGWQKLGSWVDHGDIPMHYILPKNKDILKKCEKVMKEKGTCCRVRPILPITNHPMRNAYKTAGAAL
jgi:hypothetical protein